MQQLSSSGSSMLLIGPCRQESSTSDLLDSIDNQGIFLSMFEKFHLGCRVAMLRCTAAHCACSQENPQREEMMCVQCLLTCLGCRKFITAACVQSISVPACGRQDAAKLQLWFLRFVEMDSSWWQTDGWRVLLSESFHILPNFQPLVFLSWTPINRMIPNLPPKLLFL